MLKVLVPVDGSANSDRAVEFLIRKTGLYKEPLEIHLLNVQWPIASGAVKKFIGHEEIQRYYHDEGLAGLKSARDLLDAAGVSYVFHIGVGEVPEIIARYAKDQQCQQIVIGTRGMGAVANAVLGSVATKVIHFSDVPVLLVK